MRAALQRRKTGWQC